MTSTKKGSTPIPIPEEGGHTHHTIKVPSYRPAVADASQYMHELSLDDSKGGSRRGSRNSRGSFLSIPRPNRTWRLSNVAMAAGQLTRPGMPPIQPTREILAVQIQDVLSDANKVAKDLAFAFDIDGVLVHGDRLIGEDKRALEILNGDNELGIKIPCIPLTNGSGIYCNH